MGHDLSTDTGWTTALDTLVTDVRDTRRQIAALEARESRLLSDAVDLVLARTTMARAAGRRMSRGDLAMREVCAELGAAMRVADRTVQSRLGDASTLATRLPATLVAWEQGRIDAGHVRAILDAGAVIVDDGTRARFETVVLPVAESEAPARLRAMARAVAAQLDADTAKERQRRAIADRMVRLVDLDDGIARIIADQPAALAYAIFDRLTDMARVITQDSGAAGAAADLESDPTPADDRTMDQVRADVLADLLLAGTPAAHGDGDALAAITGHVQVTVPVLTAAGIGNEPCLLAGYGPIDLDTALRLAGHAHGWDRVLAHPHTGAVLAVDRYRPSSALRRHLRARDEHCRAPGCRRLAIRADIDHTKYAAKGGATCEGNLGHFCRRHHVLKHHTAWTVAQHPGGVLEWVSPTGRHYRDRPPGTVRFVPTDWLAMATRADTRSDAPF